mmetsp:Transcript_22024/g.35383  ORF Transcript_22024/g.35383 Transcript_22024/m.35383 type:complete len:159 (+) Transcript_22024:2183-2659(+)
MHFLYGFTHAHEHDTLLPELANKGCLALKQFGDLVFGGCHVHSLLRELARSIHHHSLHHRANLGHQSNNRLHGLEIPASCELIYLSSRLFCSTSIPVNFSSCPCGQPCRLSSRRFARSQPRIARSSHRKCNQSPGSVTLGKATLGSSAPTPNYLAANS